jgi:hypothetical protein
MPRKGPAPRRELLPDPIYRSVLVTQLVNKILSRGKRSVAERIVYDALDTIKERLNSRSRAAGWAVRPTRYPWTSSLGERRRFRCAGW